MYFRFIKFKIDTNNLLGKSLYNIFEHFINYSGNPQLLEFQG